MKSIISIDTHATFSRRYPVHSVVPWSQVRWTLVIIKANMTNRQCVCARSHTLIVSHSLSYLLSTCAIHNRGAVITIAMCASIVTRPTVNDNDKVSFSAILDVFFFISPLRSRSHTKTIKRNEYIWLALNVQWNQNQLYLVIIVLELCTKTLFCLVFLE